MGSATSATRIGLGTGRWKLRKRVCTAIVVTSDPIVPVCGRADREQRSPGDVGHELPTPLTASATVVDVLGWYREGGVRHVHRVPCRVSAAAGDRSRLFADSPVPTTLRPCARAAETVATRHVRAQCEQRPAALRVSFSGFGLFNERSQLTRL